MSDESHEPGAFRLEQMALGEARHAIDEQSGDTRGSIDALRADDREILEAYPPDVVLPIVRRRAAAAKARARRSEFRWATIPALASVAAAVVVLALRTPDESAYLEAPPDRVAHGSDVRVIPYASPTAMQQPEHADPSEERATSPSDVTRTKGLQPHLVIHRSGDHGAVRLDDGSVVRGGDLLQVSYVAAGQHHGVIVSVDGASAVTLHYPDAIDGNSALEQSDVIALSHAYELDDAPDFERFVFVTADRPIDAQTVMNAAQRLTEMPGHTRTRRLSLPSRWRQSSMVLRKGER